MQRRLLGITIEGEIMVKLVNSLIESLSKQGERVSIIDLGPSFKATELFCPFGMEEENVNKTVDGSSGGGMSFFGNDKLVEKDMVHNHNNISDNFFYGGKPYGYYSVPVLSKKRFETVSVEGHKLNVNLKEAEVVKRIFEYFVDGLSTIKIAKILNTELKEYGNPKPPRGKRWTMSTLYGHAKSGKGILNNHLYIGLYSYAGETVFLANLKIIPNDLWVKVQNRLSIVKKVSGGEYIRKASLRIQNTCSPG